MESINLNTKILDTYKMKLFNELIKAIWSEEFDDIDNIPKKVLDKSVYNEFGEEVILNLMRIVMGLDPIDKIDETIKEMLNKAMCTKEISTPIISVISQVCNHCVNKEDGKECLVKEKHINCNKDNTCNSCGGCIRECSLGAISDKIQFIPILKLLKDKKHPVYATVAPSFVGQLGNDVTPGKLRSALKKVGFKDMIEVALAADILTVKESYDYCNHIKENKEECFITSCCCPIWISLIKSSYPEIVDNISKSVSPMIACARIIKVLNEDAKVVFIGPCVAKKKEAIAEDIKGAVDFVLTFKELEEIFKALDIEADKEVEENRIESSALGRIYAHAGGVSKSIEECVKKINPKANFKAITFQGAKDCKAGLEKVINKDIDVTFVEGMGCIGGCVGGLKCILETEKGKSFVQEYSKETNIKTPFENINVIQFLAKMDMKKIETLRSEDREKLLGLFNRDIRL